jgi:hypothetical protein
MFASDGSNIRRIATTSFSIADITAEYERIQRLVLDGRFTEAEVPALKLKHLLTREAGLAFTKKRLDSLLADIARHTSTNGNGGRPPA